MTDSKIIRLSTTLHFLCFVGTAVLVCCDVEAAQTRASGSKALLESAPSDDAKKINMCFILESLTADGTGKGCGDMDKGHREGDRSFSLE